MEGDGFDKAPGQYDDARADAFAVRIRAVGRSKAILDDPYEEVLNYLDRLSDRASQSQAPVHLGEVAVIGQMLTARSAIATTKYARRLVWVTAALAVITLLLVLAAVV